MVESNEQSGSNLERGLRAGGGINRAPEEYRVLVFLTIVVDVSEGLSRIGVDIVTPSSLTHYLGIHPNRPSKGKFWARPTCTLDTQTRLLILRIYHR